MERDKETSEYVHKLRFSEDFSDDVSCIVVDAVNNLRASLDQSTYAIAISYRGRESEFAYFPFASDEAHWPDKINGLKNDVPSEIRAIFERFKPYKGGNNTLWALNYLANIKKHAILVPVGFRGTGIAIPAGANVPSFAVTSVDPAKKNEIIIFKSTEPPERHPNIEISYNVRYNRIASHSSPTRK